VGGGGGGGGWLSAAAAEVEPFAVRVVEVAARAGGWLA
jgi:hypothetical protein